MIKEIKHNLFKKYLFIAFLSLCILSILIQRANSAIICNNYNDFKQFNGHYYTMTVKKMTFDEAKKLAEDSGGYLAIPNSKEENDFLSSLFKNPDFAWIGIHDPNYTSNYCMEGTLACINDDSRFRTVKGTPLSYTNWADTEPSNTLNQYDRYDGVDRVFPLGEHWVALAFPSGLWSDQGNHFGSSNNPVKNYALLEFDTLPSCAGGGIGGNTDTNTSTQMQCNTSFSDDPNFSFQGQGQTISCLQNSKQEYFCPAQLTACVDSKDVVDGSSKKIENAGIIKTGRTKVTLTFSKGIGFNTWEILSSDFYIKDINKIESFKLTYAGADDWVVPFAPNSSVSLESVGIFGAKKPSNTKDALAYIPYKPQGDFYGELSRFSGRALNIELKQYLNNGLNKSIAFFATVGSGSWSLTYEALGIGISCSNFNGSFSCKEEMEIIPFSAYEYTCPVNYQPTNSGGQCDNISSLDQLIDTNNDGIGDSCNYPTPPPKNCVGERKTCPHNPSRDCVLVDNKYQCSPFPCFGGTGGGANQIEITESPVGINDANNNGWNEDGTCSGQIIIFNGQSNRCKSWDAFGGLLKGGCCDKNNVFLGLIPCGQNEKELATKNDNGLCHEVGEFCSKRINLVFSKPCIEKKKGFCCFSSKLARIFNQQGRVQLGRGFGSAENTDCRGFTPEEFQKLDFSEIDLSEFIGDLTGSIDLEGVKANTLKIQDKINQNLENAMRK